MLRNVRSILASSILLALSAFMIVSLSSCDGLTDPHPTFRGVEKNLSGQWRLFGAQPSNTQIVHMFDPGGYFGDDLEGSRYYFFETHFEDGTVYGAFNMRINQVRGDARINDANLDWYVAWGIGSVACITPVGGGDNLASSISITIDHYYSTVGLTKSTKGMTPPAPMTMTIVTRSEMESFKRIMNDPSVTKLDQVRLFNSIRTHRGLTPIAEEK